MPCQIISLLPKHNFVFSERDFIYELCHELPNDVRLKSLRNFEILGKTQNWMELKYW